VFHQLAAKYYGNCILDPLACIDEMPHVHKSQINIRRFFAGLTAIEQSVLLHQYPTEYCRKIAINFMQFVLQRIFLLADSDI